MHSFKHLRKEGAVMHKRLWNVLKLEFELTPKSALLIKSGIISPNPSLPDMQFVRTMTPHGETVFIPGSSLKGVFRGFTEKVLRTLESDGTSAKSCNPVKSGERCEDKELKKRCNEKSPDYTSCIYKNSCHACKLYGNTRLKGRLSFTDALPKGEIKTEVRYGVAISRLTNAVSAGPFDMEVVVQGTFDGAIILENFEIWQLGLLALTLQAANEGLVRVGYGKNRGLGEVEFTVTSAVLDMAKKSGISQNELWGIGAFISDDERKLYGLRPDDLLGNLPQVRQKDLGILFRREYTGEQWQEIAKMAIEKLSELGELHE